MLRQWSVQSGQAPGEPGEPGEPAGAELWESEMERLCASQAPVRTLPYAMVDRRFIRWVPERRPQPRPRWGRGSAARTRQLDGGGGFCLAGGRGG